MKMGIRKLKNIREMGKEMDCKLLGIRTGIKKVRSITKMGKIDQEPFGLKYKNKTTQTLPKKLEKFLSLFGSGHQYFYGKKCYAL